MNHSINGKEYQFVYDYKHEELLRKGFNALSEICFEFNFENWYQAGYWKDNYIPYSLIFDGQVVANASINKMKFDFDDITKNYLQIGTVMTHPDFRNEGLSRFLIEKILEEWEEKMDLVFLYANETVLEFYPKFGFVASKEYQYSKKISSIGDDLLEKVDMNDKKQVTHLIEKISDCTPFACPASLGDVGLAMFYLSSFMKDNVYYSNTLDAFIIAEINEKNFYLMDLFVKSKDNLNAIINQIIPSSFDKITLGFVPINKEGYDFSEFSNDDTLLFVRGKDSDSILNSKIMFPLLAHT